MRKFQVVFQPSGRRGKVLEGRTVTEASRELGIEIESICGGARSCGKCMVKLEKGFFGRYGIESRPEHLSPLTMEEEKFINDPWKGHHHHSAGREKCPAGEGCKRLFD